MSTVHVQHSKTVLSSGASMLSSASLCSGSFDTRGYKTLRGMVVAGCQMTACAVRVYQSYDGATWDLVSTCVTLGASAASGFEYPIYGMAADILITPGTCSVNPFRTYWAIYPI